MTTTFLFLAMNGQWWQAEGETIRAHITWLAASEARLRDEAVDYMSKYFDLHLLPLEEVLNATEETEGATT
jgi:hypothetical protein